MFDVFAKYLLSKADFTADELQRIQAACLIRTLRKHQYLLQAGDVWTYNAFVAKGCMRSYTMDSKGTEHILNFAVENWWTGDQESLTTGQPSRYNIDAVEDSDVVLIRKEDFNQLRQELPVFNQLINSILHRSFMASQNRIHSAISYSAEEKYRDFLQRFPGLALRIPQHMVASYLGMTTETLSRIRRHLNKPA
ncbi:Crp/Fnr family transcriptional regulator [Hymenobacter volaticus]|uniref:Crp/Fnr family transcriptional regulator n=1 Tax=Hymenobacter volaticus TaxID=2932254 RepID=A0ABY4GCQ8_9BACT|nr:Crp/Fnr family transcriptional regulator [Hymenobacter volaticus]UOQ68613.1 Crp/Fnr family transcriptional regulator [Hymenobacter volaticus]